MTDEKLEFASAAWFERLHATLIRLLAAAGPEIESACWTACEVFTGVPEHIAPGAGGRAAWHARIRGRSLDFALGEIGDGECDFKVKADYQSILPVARVARSGDPARLARAGDALGRAVAEGRVSMQGDLAARPAALAALHDEMARVTA